MADGAAEEQFPQPIAAAEEAQVTPGQAAPAPQPGPAQAAQRGAECGARSKLFVLCFRVLISL